MIKLNEYGVVDFTPNDDDMRHIGMIEDFLNSRSIPYETDENIFGLYHLNDKTIQLRYVSSIHYPMDNSKRFGEKCNGVQHDYFINISHANHDKGIRTIWIFDFEMEQKNTIVTDEGITIENFPRQWEVIKNTICTATGNIDNRIYARDCEVREISNKEARMFLDTNCFYGYRSASVTMALFLKKDKCGLKKGTMLMVYSFGANFYGNKKCQDKPKIEIIRVSTKLGCQVIGGMSKCLKHFLEQYSTMKVGEREVEVDKLVFYVDASHNDSRGMQASGLAFNFVSWDGCGFMNYFCEDCCVTIEKDGKKQTLQGKRGEVFHRKPMFHSAIMKLIEEGKLISVANAGTIVFDMTRDEFLERFNS
jgi:hypothetical protein